MLSTVLRSKRAVQVNIEIMRAFVRLRRLLASNEELARKLAALERKYDAQFKVVFDAIRELMRPRLQSAENSDFWCKKKPRPTGGGNVIPCFGIHAYVSTPTPACCLMPRAYFTFRRLRFPKTVVRTRS